MSTTEVRGLRGRIDEAEAEAKRHEEQAEALHREARRLRVQAAKLEAQAQAEAALPPLRSRLRDFAMQADTFTEDEATTRLNAAPVEVRSLLEELAAAGTLARIRRGRQWVYAWLAPDGDCSPRPRQAAPETVVAMGERRRGTVAGVGRGKKLSSRRHVQDLVDVAEKQGATAEKQGDGHIRITKDGKSTTMASTPRSSSTDKIKKDLRELGIAV